MKIALLDDNQSELDSLFLLITEQIGDENIITQFKSGEDFLAIWQKNDFDLIVLDIYMNELTGMDVARKIRQSDTNVKLVFGTTSNDFASESYDVDASYYLIKPFDNDKIKLMLDHVNINEIELKRTITLPQNQTVILRNIIFAEYSGHNIVLHNKKGADIVSRISLSSFEEMLQNYNYFCVSSKGLVVNFYEVSSQKDSVFIMSDGSRTPISRRKSKEVLELYADFRFRLLRKGGA